ncbi:MAG: hypothetical protein ACOX6S_11150 [Clostridia bacterium]|jgi:hypothetical protein
MSRIRQVWMVNVYNFRQWNKNPRIWIVFALAFILCFLLSSETVEFSNEFGTTMQIVEAFIWTFGDSNSVLMASLLLVLLFCDMPFLGSGVPYYLSRIRRSTWLWGQVLYIGLATSLYLLFILVSTTVLRMRNSFPGNMWSETAALLAYSPAGKSTKLPAMVKTLELSTPFECMASIMLLYTLLFVMLMLVFNLIKGQFWGVVGAFLFSLFGFLIKPDVIRFFLGLEEWQMYRANLWAAWISPLQHATYHMYNFGYDLLPRL